MIKKTKNIVSILIVLVLLMPSIIKIEHHHNDFVCHTKTEKHFHVLHDKCAICIFEYSFFLTEKYYSALDKIDFIDNYKNQFIADYFSNLTAYSFLLRAPPLSIYN
jgi:hypothetical protein